VCSKWLLPGASYGLCNPAIHWAASQTSLTQSTSTLLSWCLFQVCHSLYSPSVLAYLPEFSLQLFFYHISVLYISLSLFKTLCVLWLLTGPKLIHDTKVRTLRSTQIARRGLHTGVPEDIPQTPKSPASGEAIRHRNSFLTAPVHAEFYFGISIQSPTLLSLFNDQ
jgi:hypothetical protein